MPARVTEASARLLTDLLYPALIFRTLVLEPVAPAPAAIILGGLLVVTLPLALAARPLAAALALPYRAVVLPVAFMNSGLLGVPVVRALAGPAAAAAAAVYDQAMSLLLFSFGVALLGGSLRTGLREVVRAPATWAIVAGVIGGASGVALPGLLDLVCAALGVLCLPVAILFVCHDAAAARPVLWRPALAGTALRIGGGAALSAAYVAAVGVEGPLRTALLLEGAMPSAVLAYVLTVRAGVPSAFAASMLLVSTAASAATAPLLARLAGA